MGLFISHDQEQTRSKLQQEIAAELREKARKKAEAAELPDGVDDSQFVKGYQQSGRFAWVWIALAAAVVIAVIIFMVQTLA